MKVFIGSSKEQIDEGVKIAGWLEEWGIDPILWNDSGVFIAGQYTLEALHNIREKIDAAIFIFAADDKTWYRGKKLSSVRDNVIFEYGFFSGNLLREKVIIATKSNPNNITDLDGITSINLDKTYNAKINLKEWIEKVSHTVSDELLETREKKLKEHSKNNDVYKQKYELMQYLFFNSDKGEGFNRFNILPKILMRMDMEQNYNAVQIGRLNIFYSIKFNKNNNEYVYDCTRKWQMNTVRNNCNQPIDTYYFYTATDIGDRHDSKLHLMDTINGSEYLIDDNAHRNNGISCWIWNIEPVVNGGDLFNDMILSEEVDCAWNFKMHKNKETGELEHSQEVIYFIPRNFAEELGVVQFDVCVDENIPILDIKLYELQTTNNGVERIFKQKFEDRGIENAQRNYHLQWDNVNGGLDMDAVYYAVLQMVD